MQLAGNAALAAALAPGQKRNFTVSLKFDWARNGLYADPNSDLSGLFVSAQVDRQLAGQFPDQLEVTEGYVAAELDIVLAGLLPADGITPAWKAFGPYSGSSLSSINSIGTPVTLDLIVSTSLGPIAIRQFTGYLADAQPDRASGEVSITCYDAATVLAAPVTLPTWAADYTTRTQFPGNPDTPDSGTVALTWVLETILRRNGYYVGPVWHPNVVCAWTLNGSALPDIGTIAIEDRFVNGVWSSGYGAYNIPQFTPSGAVSDVYGTGQFGGMCFKGATKLPALSGRGITYLYGNAHAANSGALFGVNSYGSANSNLLGFGAWVQIDPTQSGTSSATIYLEEAHFNYSSASTTDRFPAYMIVNINQATGAYGAHVYNEGNGTSWTWNGPASMSAGWHYVNFVAQFTSAGITGTFIVDGVQTLQSNGGTAAAVGAFTYSNDLTNTNLCQIIARGPMQYAQVYYQANTALAGHVQPTRTQPNPTAVLDRSMTKLTWLPDINAAPSWDTLKDAVAAELGALYVTEAGVVTFDSRTTVTGRQLAANSVLTLTLDQVDNISPQATLASLVNTMPYSTQSKHALNQQVAYASASSSQYQVSAIVGTLFKNVLQSGVQSYRLGAVSWHPQAQGYGNPSNPGEFGGGGPSAGFTYRDWMNIYGPSFWYDGFTAYTPGSSPDPSTQPTAGTGLNCNVLLQSPGNFQDSRYATLQLINSNSTGTLEYAVNDSTPFLHIGGSIVIDEGSQSASYSDAASVAAHGVRSLDLGQSDWRQDPTSVQAVVVSVVNQTKQPQPYFQSINIVGDPRLQLQDVVTITDPGGMGSAMYASVFGIKRSIDLKSGVTDQLVLRTF
jgi:hypothetical protein